MAHRPISRRLAAIALAAGALVLVAACSSTAATAAPGASSAVSAAPGASTPTDTGSTAPGGSAGNGPVSSSTSGASPGNLTENLVFSGTFNGTLTSAVLAVLATGQPSGCGPDGNGGFNFVLVGSINGQQFQIDLQDPTYQGAQQYTNPKGAAGDLTIHVDGPLAMKDAAWTSEQEAYTVTINSDQKSGTVDAALRVSGQSSDYSTPEHLTGTFTC